MNRALLRFAWEKNNYVNLYTCLDSAKLQPEQLISVRTQRSVVKCEFNRAPAWVRFVAQPASCPAVTTRI